MIISNQLLRSPVFVHRVPLSPSYGHAGRVTIGWYSRLSRTHPQFASQANSAQQRKDSTSEEGDAGSLISSVASDINKASEWITARSEPTFDVISSGLGSSLLIKLPPESEIVAATGTAIGVSSEVHSAPTSEGGPLHVTGRKLVGDPLFYRKFSTNKGSGDILLVPSRLADIATIQLLPNTAYTVRRDAFLAKSKRVSVDLAVQRTQGGITRLLTHRVVGPGTLAISSYGGLCRLVLSEKEEYLVNPKNLVAWESRTAPVGLRPSIQTIPSLRSALRHYAVVRKFADHPTVQPVLQFIGRMGTRARNLAFGEPEFVKLQGPGDFYLASRVEPRFEMSRIIGSFQSTYDNIKEFSKISSAEPVALSPAQTTSIATTSGSTTSPARPIRKFSSTTFQAPSVSPSSVYGLRSYSTTSEPCITEDSVHINGKNYPLDTWSNITPSILAKTTRKLHLHPSNPISIIRTHIENHFATFKPFNTYHPVVTTRQNFDDLYIPADHPSRKISDNYYINQTTMLRAHTSAHQLQGLRSGDTKFLISGDVYRRDEIDASHYPVFHQMEGFQYFDMSPSTTADQVNADIASRTIMVTDMVHTFDDTIINAQNPIQASHPTEVAMPVIAHLKHSLNSMVRMLFCNEPDLQVKWVDAYFPFTSPSWEMEILYKGNWLEICGCGIVHQGIMNAAGLPDKVGWAFGFGLERLAMVLFDISDIRLFWSQDARFLDQFAAGEIVKFQPFSKYPPCTKDLSFWLSGEWNENNFCSVVREVAGDIVEDVKKIDDFVHPKTNKRSMCYRIIYRSMDRNVTNEEINDIQEVVRMQVKEKLDVELR